MHHPPTQNLQPQQEKLVALILEAVPVEKIYMLGNTISQQQTESIFLTTPSTSCSVSHYYLLVLVNKDAANSDHQVQDKIENTCRSFIPVTVIVLDMAQFNNWLLAGHRFACTVIKMATPLHERNDIPLADPMIIPGESCKTTEQAYYTQAINRVKEFIAGAELYKLRAQNKMAAFMLHQAAEHALLTIFKNATDLHINTHNIDKLVRYCSMVSYKIPAIFPRNNDANEKLFQLLQKAYIDTRYKEDYSITTSDLLVIMERVKTLQVLIEEVFD